MADNINLNLNNNSLDRFSNGFSLPSVVVMPQIKNNKRDNYVPATKPEQNNVKPEQNTTKPEVTKPENNNNPTHTTKESPEQKKPLGKIVFYSMLVAAGFVLLLTKGLSGSTAGKIRRFADKWENKLLQNASKNKVAGAIDTTISKTSQKIKRLFSLSDAIANFTAIKDTIFHKITSWEFLNIKNKYLNFQPIQKFLNKWVPIQRICNFFTRNVLKISYGAVDSKYKIVNSAVDGLEARLKKALVNSKNATPEQVLKISSLIDRIIPTLHKGFSQSTRNGRIENIHNGLTTLADDVSKRLASPFKNSEGKGIKAYFKNLFGKIKKNYSSYVTPTLAEPVQTKHKKAIDVAKRAFSNEVSDVSIKLQNAANDLKHCFTTSDTESRSFFGDLLEKLDKYKWLSGTNEKVGRETLQKEILSTLNQIKDKVTNYSFTDKKGQIVRYSKDELSKISDLISSMQETLTTSSQKGLLQDILTELKPLISAKEYKSLKAGVRNVNELLNQAIDSEGNNLLNKIAESKVGSIPTDMVGLAALGGTGLYAVSQGRDKQERLGATLKVGIQMLGTIGTYFYSAAKAFSGTTNLIFSAAAGFALNRIGDSIYNFYQKRFVENKSVKEIVKDTYEDATKT